MVPLIVVVIVVPSLAQGDQGQDERVAARVCGDVPPAPEHVRQRVDREGAVVQHGGRQKEADDQPGPAIDRDAGDGEEEGSAEVHFG